uniref:Putative notch signaling protein n=1 Tax=Xenopsylla cheopis TaxID=163159 RepID=A0A6M2E0Q8_XENCH
MNTEPMFVGALALGLTSCDPAKLTQADLPDDSEMLLDRPEYWVVTKIAGNPERDDQISFCLTATGEVQISKNNSPKSVLMHVDQSLQLWAFLDIYGSTQSVRMMSVLPTMIQPPSHRLHVCLSASNIAPESMNGSNLQAEQQRRPSIPPRLIQMPSDNDMLQLQSVPNGGAVLVVNLPPANSSSLLSNANHHAVTKSSGSIISTRSCNSFIEPVSSACSAKDNASAGPLPGEECTICYENLIDCVLYMCGHMCMCYECAIQQWRGKGGGHCPLCRAVIRDVIRTYKSC